MVYQFSCKPVKPVPRSARNATALPVYIEIAEMLIRDIAAGRLIDGERLAPEREMAAELGVSVGTLRKSLRELEKKDMLERVQGSGNYIRDGAPSSSIYAMFRLELPQGGGLLRADVLAVDHMDKPADLPTFGSATHASRVRRLRYLNDTIIAVEEIWLDGAAGIIDPALLSDSLYRYYKARLGFWIRRAEDRVSIGQVPEWAPAAFPHPPGATVGYIERFSWAEPAAAVEFSRTWFDPTRAIYVQRLK